MTDLDLGSFTIDPRSDIYRYTKPICDPGNPSACVINNFARTYRGVRRITVRNLNPRVVIAQQFILSI